MDHKREHRTPPTSKGHGSGYTTTSKKKSLDCSLYKEFADMMCDRVHTDLVSLSTSMIEMGEEIKW